MFWWAIIWPLLVVLLYSIHAYFSYQNKNAEGWLPLLTVWAISVCISPLWAIISRHSKNLLFDGILYDVLIFAVYAVAFMWLEQHYLTFRPINYIGIGLILLGMIFLKFAP